MMTQKSTVLTVTINRPPAEVSHFVLNPENMPDWAPSFCESIDRQEGDWVINTPNGQMKVRFTEANPYGVLDHHLTAPERVVYVPMRVVANGSGSEVMFTLYQAPGVTDARLAEHRLMIERDLQTLKRVLEG